MSLSKGAGKAYRVYALQDPRTKEYRYVGVSRNPRVRLNQHLHDPRGGQFGEWVRGLQAVYLRPTVAELEVVCGRAQALEAEHRWIANLLGFGHRLTNREAGGDERHCALGRALNAIAGRRGACGSSGIARRMGRSHQLVGGYLRGSCWPKPDFIGGFAATFDLNAYEARWLSWVYAFGEPPTRETLEERIDEQGLEEWRRTLAKLKASA